MKSAHLRTIVLVFLLSLTSRYALSQDVEWQLSEGDVGVGTGSPATKLHVVGDGGTAVEEILRLETRGAPQQLFQNSATGAKWFFAMAGDDSFKISFAGTGKVETRIQQNGNMIIAGALTENSDINSKSNIAAIDDEDILRKVVALPISSWEYKADSGVTHLGPMAQDFYAAFGLGPTPKGISTIDTAGVALAAIQGLHKQLETKSGLIAQLEEENRALKAKLQQYDERMHTVEMTLSKIVGESSSQAQYGSRDW